MVHRYKQYILQVYGWSYMVIIRIINFVTGKLLLGKCKDVATITLWKTPPGGRVRVYGLVM